MKSFFLKASLLLLLLVSFACSKEDSEPGPTPNPPTNSTPDPDPDPDPDPNPDPNPVSQADISKVDNAIAAFMAKYDIPGAALAVSVNEKMVYSKGFGFSNVADNTPTQADDLFRIASISKVFTATAVWKLIDEGKLALTDKIFGPNSLLGADFGTATLTNDELNMTLDHLLTHELGGWSVATGGDPIDYQPQLNSDDFIAYILNNWNLSYAPGNGFAYSNTGYWLLARIIEKTSGLPYETYVGNLLSPTGVTTFKTTTFRTDDREANEVEYYGTAQDAPYIYTIASRRDGDGGVVISAPDLLRFLCGIDGKTGRPDLISANALNGMAQPSAHQANIGRGIAIWEQENLKYFSGSLPGTRSWFMISENGRSAVLLLNYRRSDLPAFDQDFQSVLLNVIKDNTISWQTDLDQF